MQNSDAIVRDKSLEVSDAVVKRLTVDDIWQFFSVVGNGADNQHNQLVQMPFMAYD